MTTRSVALGAALAVVLLLGAESLAQVITANKTVSYNSYTGRYNARGGAHNTLTGSTVGGRTTYNPMTGRTTHSAGAYNGVTGRGAASRSSYNPMTGRATHSSVRRY